MKVEFHGDSTQFGVSTYSGVSIPAPVRVSDYVALAHPTIQVVNCAKSGSTLVGALRTNLYAAGTFAQHLAQSDADVIVANWGLNDAYVSGYAPATHRWDWQEASDACTAHGKRLVIQTPNPMTLPHNVFLEPLAAASAGVTSAGRIDIYTAIKRWYPQWEAHLSDGLHPNSIMYLYMGMLVAQSPAFLIAINPGT